MRKFLVAAVGLFLSYVLMTICVFGQEVAKEKAVIVPPNYVLPTIISQPDCPLKIEQAVVVKYLTGRIDTLYLIRNTGTKPIRSYTLARWYSDNTGLSRKGVMPSFGQDLQHGQTAGSFIDSPEIVPLTDSLREKLKINQKSMERIVFFMIVEIEFSDGTRYDASKVFDAFEEHLKKFALGYETK